MEKAISLFFSIRDTQEEIRKESERFIKDYLKKHGNSVDITECEDMISVTYDGGIHPEYNSNAFSMVEGIYLNENGAIYLQTEDCDKLGIDRINWDEVYYVAIFIYTNLNK